MGDSFRWRPGHWSQTLSKLLFLLSGLLLLFPALASARMPNTARDLHAAVVNEATGRLHLRVHGSSAAVATNLLLPQTNELVAKAQVRQWVAERRDLSLLEPADSAFYHARELRGQRRFPLLENPPQSLRYDRAIYRNGRPVIEAHAGGRRFQLVFGPEIFPELAVAKILHAQGFYTAKQELVTDLPLNLSSAEEIRLRQFWLAAERPLSIPRWLGTGQDTSSGREYTITQAMLVEIDPVAAPSEQWSWSEHPELLSRREYRAYLLLAMWLQNFELSSDQSHRVAGDGTKYFANFATSLGDVVTESGVNLLQSNLFPDAQAAREIVLQGRNSGIETHYAAMGEAATAFNYLHLSDIRWAVRKLSRFSSAQIRRIFRESGYPEVIARIYASKLISRLNSLIYVFAPQEADGSFLQPVPRENLAQINAEPYVREGQALRNIPGFPVNIANDGVKHFIEKNGGQLFRLADALAKEMFAHAPFVGVERALGKTGMHWGPGWILRVERKVKPNPNPTGNHDLYLVKDKFKVTIVLGVGIGGQILGLSTWGNIAPGWNRSYVYIYPAASEQAAWDGYWTMQSQLLRKAHMDVLQPGETLMIRDGFSANIIGGGNIRIMGWRGLRVSSYLLQGFEMVWGSQLRRRSDGTYVLITEDGRQSIFGTKTYLRVLHRLIRVPIAHIGTGSGNSVYTAWVQKQGAAQTEAERAAIAIAMEERDAEAVATYFDRYQVASEYDLARGMFNVYGISGRRMRGSSEEERIYPDGSRHRVYWSNGARYRGSRLGSGRQESECEANGLIEFAVDDPETVKDLYVESRCSVSDEATHASEWEHLVALNALHLGGRFSPAFMAPTERPLAGRMRVDAEIRLSGEDLQRLFAITEEEFESVAKGRGTFWQQWAVALDNALRPEEKNKVLRMYEALDELRQIFAADGVRAKLDAVVELLARGKSLGMARFLLLNLVQEPFLRAELRADVWASTTRGFIAEEFGVRPQGPAAELLQDWRATIGTNYLRHF